MSIENLILIGGGGHVQVVIDALRLGKNTPYLRLYDHNPEKIGSTIAGILIECAPQSLNEITTNVHVAIGNNAARATIYQCLSAANLITVIHPSAVISVTSQIGKGCFIAALSLLAPQTKIGKGCIINHGAIIDHDVTIGTYTHIAPNCTLGGNVTVGSGVLIGAGAVILPQINIGDGAIIGAGSVVTRNVAANCLVKGCPAK